MNKKNVYKKEEERKQIETKAGEQEKIEQILVMEDEEVLNQSIARIVADTERMTRRNLKECVSEYIQTRCLEDPNFARLTLYPRKNMAHCIRRIIRKAKEYLEDNQVECGLDSEENRILLYGNVPDELCYEWAEDYFRDMNAAEDQEKNKEVNLSENSNVKDRKAAEKKAENSSDQSEKKIQTKELLQMGQISLFDLKMEG